MTSFAVDAPLAEARLDACLALLRALVEAESQSRDEDGNLRVADLLAAALAKAGGRVERIPAPGLGAHLIARFDGASAEPSSGSRPDPVLVLGHVDTVHPAGTLDRRPFDLSGGQVQGPGVYDMKAGLAVATTALGVLAELGQRPRSGVTFMATCDEEIGSPDSRPRIEAEARASKAALVLEPSVPGGAAKTRRKGVADYVLEVSGQSAHAGIEPEKGASAVREAARQVARIYELAAPEAGTTVNVGTISGGTAGNVVAAQARCSIDVRFWKTSEGQRVDADLRSLAPVDDRCALRLQGGINRGALERTPESARLFEKAQRVAEQIGFRLQEGATGGASDGNFTSAVGCPTLDGLGPDGAGAHTLHEHVLLADLPKRIRLLAALFQVL